MDRNGTEILRAGRGKIWRLMEGQTGDGGGRTNDAGAGRLSANERAQGCRLNGKTRACVYIDQARKEEYRTTGGQILMNTGGRAGDEEEEVWR